MTEITAKEVKALRDRTGAGVLACREALTESGGDVDRAVEILRARGQAQAAKRAGAEATEGVVQTYVHAGNKTGGAAERHRPTRLRPPHQQVRRVPPRRRAAHSRRESARDHRGRR